LDKAPDAFRTISEVADELDIPQHVLRFWETRFAQIKPMKRSGGRRYYRPDDVDLLKGIRRLLYGEGYTIRGVQRILKEHGVRSVQGIADQSAAVSFGAVEEAIGHSLRDPEGREAADLDGDDEDSEGGDTEDGIDYRFVDPNEDDILAPFAKSRDFTTPPSAASGRGISATDRERLQRALAELVGCRKLLDTAMKDGSIVES
jgi:DNA-binding transcriptional MerR regulator